ncbi:MAG: hypothetical protein MJ102_06165 [Clostridia bacterium]|nr:hypothetical protein [Clostridia bacterium]
MKMKKLIAILLAAVLCFAAVSCKGEENGNTTTVAESTIDAPSESTAPVGDDTSVPADDTSAADSQDTVSDSDITSDPSSASIVGSWGFDIDLSGTITAMYAQLGIDGMTIDSVILPLIFVFKDDGSASLKVDEAKKDAFVSDYVEKALKGFEDYMLMIMKEGGQEGTLEDVYAALGMTREEFGKSISDAIDTSSFASDMKYVLRDGKLFIYDEAGGEAFDANDYVTVEIGKDEMKFIEYHPAKEGALFLEGLVTLPVTLPRIK